MTQGMDTGMGMASNRWLLPDGLEEALPDAAWILEDLRRRILDQFAVWGYDLVMPPMAEYLDSLLVGVGQELDLQTFKLTDQLTGRTMGVRADLTPQVARIDAHRLRHEGVTRLCYVGTVLRTRADEWSGSRSPLQAGAELFGHDGLDSDSEVLSLMLETLRLCGVTQASIDLGHVHIFRALAQDAGLDGPQEHQLFDILQRKAIPELEQILASGALDPTSGARLRALVDLNGGPEVLVQAQSALAGAPEAVMQALAHTQAVVARLQGLYPELDIHVDLAELRGYAYHTGLVFAAFMPGSGQEIARGGRYNGIGRAFGRARPATGFSLDLKQLLRLLPPAARPQPTCIIAPSQEDAALEAAIRDLRAQGIRVVRALEADAHPALQQGCKRLVLRDKTWSLEEAV